jgi:hypothetical protein
MNDDHDKFVARATELRPALWKTKDHNKKCQVCLYWVHEAMQDCQPCVGSDPQYSKLHQLRK